MSIKVLLVGKKGIVLGDAKDHLQMPDLELFFAPTDDDQVKAISQDHSIQHVFMGAGIEIEQRLEIIRAVLQDSENTTVHLKDVASGPKGFFPLRASNTQWPSKCAELWTTSLTIESVSPAGDVTGAYVYMSGNPSKFVTKVTENSINFGSRHKFTFRLRPPDSKMEGTRNDPAYCTRLAREFDGRFYLASRGPVSGGLCVNQQIRNETTKRRQGSKSKSVPRTG